MLLEQALQKYKFMEANLLAKKARLSQQIPDLKSALQLVGELQSKNLLTEDNKESGTMDVKYLLSDHVYGKARVGKTDKVMLWLGANVMLEYPLEEAKGVLDKSMNSAVTSLDRTDKDLTFLIDQVNTTQVNTVSSWKWL